MNFCFDISAEYDNDDIKENVEDSSDDIVGKDDFKTWMDVYYKRGNVHNETARHIKTVKVNGTKLHKIQLSAGTLTKVPACHLQLLEQPYLTNIPIDVENYFKDVEAVLTTEDIAALASHHPLSPLQKDFLYWPNRLYHMPNNCLIQLAKERVIPHRLAAF